MRRRPAIAWLLFLTVCLLGGTCSLATAQNRRSSASDRNTKIVKLPTKDGVEISATYYASSLGEQAVPVVLLHNHKESRARFESLARRLQNPSDPEMESKAVLAVDLRGHGDSLMQSNRYGQSRKLDAARFGQNDFRDMVTYDMEAVRKFLVTENDAHRLNLNKLCLLGSGMGANVATSWAAVDWSAPPLAVRKQGQDVKGLILVSPDWKYRGLPMLKPLQQPGVQKKVSVLIAFGNQDSRATKSAQTVYKNLRRHRPEPPRDQIREKETLFVFPLPTSLQGTELLTARKFGMLEPLEEFIDAKLSGKEFEWLQRRNVK